MPDWAPLQGLLDQGAAAKVAPALTLLAQTQAQPPVILTAGLAEPDTIFDLASLTKPLATALIALELEAEGVLPRAATLGDIWGQAVPAEKQGISLHQLLTHAAGFPAWRPYFELLRQHPRGQRGALLKAMLLNEPLEQPPGRAALYSDLGYLLLGLVLEEAAGRSLDQSLRRVYAALEVEGPRYLPLDRLNPPHLMHIAPCGPLPGRPVVHGQVEDENAYALGGIAGHAGLFGNARQVAAVMDALCRSAQGKGPWPAELVQGLFIVDDVTPGSGRTPGFDTPSGPESAAGDNAPPGVVGHLGFTGVSLWWHPASNQGLVLLTNRVAYGRDNGGIKEFRRQVHQAAWPLLGL